MSLLARRAYYSQQIFTQQSDSSIIPDLACSYPESKADVIDFVIPGKGLGGGESETKRGATCSKSRRRSATNTGP